MVAIGLLGELTHSTPFHSYQPFANRALKLCGAFYIQIFYERLSPKSLSVLQIFVCHELIHFAFQPPTPKKKGFIFILGIHMKDVFISCLLNNKKNQEAKKHPYKSL